MQHSHPILAFKPLIPLLPTLYLLPLHPYHRLMLLAVFLHLLLPLPPDYSSGFSQWNARVFMPRALNFYTLFHLIPLTLFVSRNLTLIHLPLCGSLDSLLGDLIAPTPRPGILSPDAMHTGGSAIIFVRQGLSSSELSNFSLFLLDPYSNDIRVNISLNNNSLLPFLNVYLPLIHSFPMDSKTDSFFLSTLSSSRNLFILRDFNCHYPLWGSKDTY